MKRYFPACHVLLFAVVVWTACAPRTTAIPSLPVPTKSVPSAVATSETEPLWLKSGFRYQDSTDDAGFSFLDVIRFQVTVDEETETVEAVFTMRDIPPTAERGLVKNVAEYQWDISVYLNPDEHLSEGQPADYYLYVWSFTLDPTTGVNETNEANITATGEPTLTPMDQLWTNASINDRSNESIGPLNVVVDPDLDTLTLRGVIPGITSGAGFRYATQPYSGIEDQPDDFVPDGPANPSVVIQPATQAPSAPVDPNTHLVPAGAVRAYPGPEHYAGDILTLEILTDNAGAQSDSKAKLTLDNNAPYETSGQWLSDRLVLPLAVDTSGLTGKHSLRIEVGTGTIDQVYAFEVLPASERPTAESQATWQSRAIACCILHYISGTAAPQDIDLLAEHFQKAAETITKTTERKITQPLEVYFIDRMWGNGAFGSNGELVVTYTDRYFGPTVDMAGWETLAQHEFTHALGLDQGDDGFVFYNEGLAVFLAGGHYKPEPIAERAAALYDLGHFVPIGQSIGQHELGYLYGASVMAYIQEKYGFEGLWKFVNAADVHNSNQSDMLNGAIQSTFGISLVAFQQDFEAWLQSHDPGNQLDDLRLTVELQDLRREYQETYAPPPSFIAGKAAEAVARREYLPVMIREVNAPPNVATELIIANAQRAIVDGDYDMAEQLINVLEKVVMTGSFEDPLAKDYLDIVLALSNDGYEVLSLELEGDQATTQVTMEPRAVARLELEKIDQRWQVRP